MLRRTLLVSLAAVLIALPAASQSARAEKLRRDFESKKRTLLIEAGQRHLELGVWCRDKGLIQQASMEFIRAVEVSEHKHPGASQVLSIMRSLGDDFWRRRRKGPSKSLITQYGKRADKATKTTADERYDLARWAHKRELPEGATEFKALVEHHNEPLSFNKKDQVVIEEGTIPTDVSASIRSDAVEINGDLWMRDEFLSKLPDVSSIHQVENDDLRVRSQIGQDLPDDILACCSALLPMLTEDTNGYPQDKMTVFLFQDTATYGAFLDATGRSSSKVAAGLALSRSNVALVNTDGRSDEDIRAIALHELSHLFMFSVTRSRMPSWYSEGFAETYGGQGCFDWDGKELATRGVMADYRIDALAAGDVYIPFDELLSADVLTIMQSDKDRALVFYAQSWALMRYFRTEAPKDLRKKFETWEFICRGKALGAVFGRPTEGGNRGPAMDLFDQTFAGEYQRLEQGFREYLAEL